MNSPDDLDSALTDALHRRADGISVPNDGRARFDQMLAQDTRNRHRRRVGMSLVGIVAVVAIGAAAVGFATRRGSEPKSQTVAAAAADDVKLRAPTEPSNLPKLLPDLPDGWVLDNAGDYGGPSLNTADAPASEAAIGRSRLQLYRSPSPAGPVVRVDIRTEPGGGGFDTAGWEGDPNATITTVRGHEAVVTTNGGDDPAQLIMWAEDPQTTVSVTADGLTGTEPIDFANGLQPDGATPATDDFTATVLPQAVALTYAGPADLPMGYGGPSWSLGYRGPEDLSQPSDPFLNLTATMGTEDALTVYPAPRGRTEAVTVAGQPALLVDISRDDPTQQQMRELLWRDTATGLVFTMSASGTDAATMVSFAASLHPVSEEEWQAAVAAVRPLSGGETPEPGFEEPASPETIPALATGSLDGRSWTINGLRFPDSDEGLVCGELAFDGGDMVGSACAETTSSRPGIGVGSDGANVVFAATEPAITRVEIVRTGLDPLAVDTVPSSDPSIPLRWFVASVGDPLKVTAIVGYDESGAEVVRVDQPLGPPYPDYRVLESAPKRDLAADVVDGATWTLTGADSPLSDGTGPVTCVTLKFASESASTCPIRVAGGVNGNGIIDATVAVLRRRTFVLAHLERSVAEFCVTLDDGEAIIVPVVATGSPSGWTTAVVHVPTGRIAVELHAIDVDGSDMGAISAEPAEASVRPMPLEISARPAKG